MDLDTPGLAEFIAQQTSEFGGKVEIDAGLWAVFGVNVRDLDGRELVRGLLEEAPFTAAEGTSEDEAWLLYYVETPGRAVAVEWLEDWQKRLAGEVREATLAQREQMGELVESTMPHRVAQKLAEEHAAGRLSAGCVRAPDRVRALLDRLHLREPLFYAAFQTLLANHLIDLVVLLDRMIPEDVDLANEAVRGAVSRDPFVQTKQAAAVEIRRLLVDYHLINSLDQQKNTAVRNPYAAHFDLQRNEAETILPLDGVQVTVPAESLVKAIRSTRRNVYNGGEIERFDTQAPWMRPEIAHPFRFLKRQLEIHRELSTLDGLYMIERAVTA